MLEARRQELLRVLGVDQYQRRSIARQSPVVEESPAEVAPLPDVSPVELQVKSTRTAEPQPTYEKAEKQVGEPQRLLWWQFEDLLFIEDAKEDTSSLEQPLLRLAKNIAAALGRGDGLNGELNWPPGGDFTAISQTEFLQHFVRGREIATTELKLILTSDALQQQAENLGEIYRIESLQAMLVDPSLKSATWQCLNHLRRP